ncbi:hypothetical protein E2C01_087863 [Portunus trituberculatus]|uniref:Uncharacterized protein n=1 Tax=Portunus trituberculatus TaxID=210409 RepID=A0A5B7JHM8_PORTR|nr:hypothetical protein [Portunus trituberculatus]
MCASASNINKGWQGGPGRETRNTCALFHVRDKRRPQRHTGGRDARRYAQALAPVQSPRVASLRRHIAQAVQRRMTHVVSRSNYVKLSNCQFATNPEDQWCFTGGKVLALFLVAFLCHGSNCTTLPVQKPLKRHSLFLRKVLHQAGLFSHLKIIMVPFFNLYVHFFF